jgi:drug/metabolite transporter (DMT)-like permease
MTTTQQPNRLLIAYLALASVCIIWGTTYLAIRIGVSHFPPFLFSMIRFLIAGPILIVVTILVGKTEWPSKKALINQAIGGFFMITMGISVVGWAEMYISSGVAAIICSVMPIWTILINLVANRDEKINWIIVLGLLVGMSGILLIFSEHLTEFSDSNYTLGIVFTFMANLSWAIGSVFTKKKNQTINPFLGAGLQMFFGGLMLLPLSIAFDNYTSIQWSKEVVYSLGYMILIGSVAGYACYAYAIKKLPMTIVSLYAYINPIVAVILGWAVLHEKLNSRIGLAIALTIVGVYMVNKGYQLRNAYKIQTSKA